MTVLNFTVANIEPFSNTETAVLFGKNGFKTTIGDIRLLCDSFSIVNDNIRFSISSLDNCFDENFYKHVLEVNDTNLYPNRLRGEDYLAFPVNEKLSDSFVENFSGFRPRVSQYTSQIVNYNTASNFIEIRNDTSDGGSLLDKLPDPPFFVGISQLVDLNLTANNSVYIRGNSRKIVKENSISTISSAAFNQPLGITPLSSNFIKVFIDGIEDSSFTHIPNTSYVTVNLDAFRTLGAAVSAQKIRTEVQHYSEPLIEKGDNISIISGNTYSIANVSYDLADPSYNAALTANSIYKVIFAQSPRASLSGRTAINIAEDPLGIVSNVVALAGSKRGTLSFGYDGADYPGSFNLSNTGGYALSSTADFEDLFFGSTGQQIIKDNPIGLTLVRARNVNTARRRSAYNTQSVFIKNIPIPRVQNLTVEDSLYIDVIRGASLRVTVKFDKINFRDVTDYEIAYKMAGSTRTALADDKNTIVNLTNFNVVKIPNNTSSIEAGVEKVSFTINNLDRGPRNNPNRILVKVTPLNGDIRGEPVEVFASLSGKRSPPLPVLQFQVGQLLDQLVFSWQLQRDASGSLRDLDLEKVEIRRVGKSINVSDPETLLQEFGGGGTLVSVSAPSSTASIPVPSFSTSTYMAQAIDTSGNKSSIAAVVFTPVRPSDLHTFLAFSEDNPNLPFTTDYRGQSITNNNEAEENQHGEYPSQNTLTGGLSVAGATSVDLANGFASGWATVADATDLQASANAVYVTQIRDVGSIIKGKVLLDTNGNPFGTKRWYNEFETITTSSTEPSNSSTILVDRNISGTIGSPTANGVGKYFQLESPHGVLDPGESTIIYDSLINNTITSKAGTEALDLSSTITAANFSGHVYAIWNPGQFAGDVSNANSFALIAGLANANALALGQAYYANGNPIKDAVGKLAHELGADYSVTNSMPNLTTATAESGATYEIVNLDQYRDDLESTFIGIDPSIINQNVQIRYAASNPYYANGNVNISTFSTNTATNDGYVSVGGFDKEFRYFQIRFKIENLDPATGNFNLDTLRYSVDIKDKLFIRDIRVDTEDWNIDYTSAEFLGIPFVNGQMIDAPAGSYTIMMRDITTTSCNVSIYDETGSTVTGEYIQFEARGI